MDNREFELKQSASKASHDVYDGILSSLNKDMHTFSVVKSNLVDMAFLSAKNYLSYQQNQDNIEEFLVTLRPEGCIFITEGGFAEQDRLAKERNDEIERNIEVARNSIKYSRYSLWISIVATLITLGALIYSICQPDKLH